MNSHSIKSGLSTLFTSHFSDYPVNMLLLKNQHATGNQEWITIRRNRCANQQTHLEEQVVSVSLTSDVQPTLFFLIT